jgi:hypothetical protein
MPVPDPSVGLAVGLSVGLGSISADGAALMFQKNLK